jgi:hypothetical protein
VLVVEQETLQLLQDHLFTILAVEVVVLMLALMLLAVMVVAEQAEEPIPLVLRDLPILVAVEVVLVAVLEIPQGLEVKVVLV